MTVIQLLYYYVCILQNKMNKHYSAIVVHQLMYATYKTCIQIYNKVY